MKTLIASLLLIAASPAFANNLTGIYKNMTNSTSCDLQGNQTFQVIAAPDQFGVSLFMGDYDPANPFSPIFTAEIGDVITHPTPAMAQMGAQNVRTIGSYNGQNVFNFAEFRYPADMSDADGLKTPAFQNYTIYISPNGMTYSHTYSDGEIYTCQLTREN